LTQYRSNTHYPHIKSQSKLTQTAFRYEIANVDDPASWEDAERQIRETGGANTTLGGNTAVVNVSVKSDKPRKRKVEDKAHVNGHEENGSEGIDRKKKKGNYLDGHRRKEKRRH